MPKRTAFIIEHNKKIAELRKQGLLPYLGMGTRSMLRLRRKKIKEKSMEENTKVYLSRYGSPMPNRYLNWEYGERRVFTRPTPLLDGTEYINEDGFRMKTLTNLKKTAII